MKEVRWQELRDVFLLLGFVVQRITGDHLIMSKPGVMRPIVIKMDRRIGEDIVRSNMRTAGIDRKTFDSMLERVRGRK